MWSIFILLMFIVLNLMAREQYTHTQHTHALQHNRRARTDPFTLAWSNKRVLTLRLFLSIFLFKLVGRSAYRLGGAHCAYRETAHRSSCSLLTLTIIVIQRLSVSRFDAI